MKPHLLNASAFASALMLFCGTASAQTDATPAASAQPSTMEEKEAMYNTVIEHRTTMIMEALALTDAAKSNRVQSIIIAHYHALRSRDIAIDEELGNMPQGTAAWQTQRLAMLPEMSKPLHDLFIAKLSKDLTPEQIETVKNKMTYGKVDFTYNAYCLILPNLTAEEKAKIMELLKQARDVAMDGGSAGEKTAIFQQYKDQINAYLATHGYDVAKATQEWSEKQKVAQKSPDANPAPAGK